MAFIKIIELIAKMDAGVFVKCYYKTKLYLLITQNWGNITFYWFINRFNVNFIIICMQIL